MLDNIINQGFKSPGTNVPRQERLTENADDPNNKAYYINMYSDHGAQFVNLHPIVMKEGKGVFLWDIHGKRYYDFMSAYCSVNQGHCHPKIMEVAQEQMKKLTMISLTSYTDQLALTTKYLTEKLGFDKVMLLNTGADAVDMAILIARKWAYKIKKVPKGQAGILFATDNYWGMTIAARVGSDQQSRKENFEPLENEALKFDFVKYNDVKDLEAKFKENPNLAAFVVEPIQGDAGIVYPDDGYLKNVRELCTKYNVLMVVDDIHAGLGRTGKLFTHEWDGIKPDMVTEGKSLSGGFYPISCVLGSNEVMNVLEPGDMFSTYACNPLASAIARASVEVLFEENLIENSFKLGKFLAEELNGFKMKYKFIKEVRCGKGLFAAIEFNSSDDCKTIIKQLVEDGIFVKSSGTAISLMPPLVISEEQLRESLGLIDKALKLFEEKGTFNLSTSTG